MACHADCDTCPEREGCHGFVARAVDSNFHAQLWAALARHMGVPGGWMPGAYLVPGPWRIRPTQLPLTRAQYVILRHAQVERQDLDRWLGRDRAHGARVRMEVDVLAQTWVNRLGRVP